MKTINIKLSTKSIQKAKKELQEYKAEIRRKCNQAIAELANYGLEICKAKIVEMKIYDTGQLDNSVNVYLDEAQMQGFIRVSCDYAVFVEFGTGTKGIGTPYIGEAMSKVGYKYMGGTQYITLNDGRIGWFYPADDGTWRFTEGLPSRPFMYETGQELRNNLKSILSEVFRK